MILVILRLLKEIIRNYRNSFSSFAHECVLLYSILSLVKDPNNIPKNQSGLVRSSVCINWLDYKCCSSKSYPSVM